MLPRQYIRQPAQRNASQELPCGGVGWMRSGTTGWAPTDIGSDCTWERLYNEDISASFSFPHPCAQRKIAGGEEAGPGAWLASSAGTYQGLEVVWQERYEACDPEEVQQHTDF